ncbi:Serpentine receptor class r-10 [Caenorhabditis elegans]|uniref:Serpentine receptor class r-10 n=1 Tax=Caenorhabditis elegans TaxID=6239 RepID=Q9N480_CAEEL|nr:Seven TM Receptor [Caenorhabditis elegans]CCD72234.1 Seven TM Receptor [Caenorhabditis elegans]|eukprot:NP_001041019.1 Seven TM Receptor [Caenorhabditis elegans]
MKAKVDFEMLKLVIQVVSVFLSITINSILICLIITKSPKIMGTYRHLMIYFCCCSIFFSIVDVIVQPNIQTYQSSFFMVIDAKSRSMEHWVVGVLMHLLCACFGVAIYGIAIHFVYRYFALERQGRVKYFNKKYLVFWFTIPLLGGAAWYAVTECCLTPDQLGIEYIRATVKESFSIEMENAEYTGCVFYPLDTDGKQFINWRSFMGYTGYLSIMAVAFLIISFAGCKSCYLVSNLLDQGESEFSKNLQMQLYKALVAQTVIPVVLLFIPFGLLFTLPIFEINCQFLATIITLIFAIYPAVDPLPILYFVEYYRIPILEVFKKPHCSGSQVYPASNNSVEN